MSSSVAPQLRAQLLRAFFQPDLPNLSPHAIDIGLTTNVVDASQPSQSAQEPTTPDYVRVTLPLTSGAWTLSGYNTILNIAEIYFPAPTQNWGSIKGWAMFASGGTILYAAGPVTPTVVSAGGSAPVIPALAIGLRLYD